MNFRPRIAALLLALSTLLAATPAVAATPGETVAQLHDALLALAGDSGCEARIARIEAAVDASYDIPGIARRMLRSHWSSLSDTQQQAFIEALRTNTVLQYVTRFGSATKLSFTTGVEKAQGATLTQVDTLLRGGNGKEVSLQYLLRAVDGGWRIINIMADGVSDAALRRTQYDSQIKKEGIDGLLKTLAAQNEELRSKCESNT